jgi:hypothetical protein
MSHAMIQSRCQDTGEQMMQQFIYDTLRRLLPCFLMITIAVASQQKGIQAAGGSCVNVFDTWAGDPNIANVFNVNPQTGATVEIQRPIIPPNAMFSPDGKYAAFWRIYSLTTNEGGLYIANVATQQITLVTKSTEIKVVGLIDNYAASYWSPDSRKFGYIGPENGQFVLTMVNADGSGKERHIINANRLTRLDNVSFSGWSADSTYIAASLIQFIQNSGTVEQFELQVWSANGLAQYSPDIDLGGGVGDQVAPMAWSPTGHRLALLLTRPNDPDYVPPEGNWRPQYVDTLAIWSPEKNIEAQGLNSQSLSDSEVNEYNVISWSPNEKQLRLLISWGHGYNDEIFGIRGKDIVRNRESSDIPRHGSYLFRRFIAWTVDDSALMLDTVVVDQASTNELYLLDQRIGYHKTLSRETVAGHVSNDRRYVALAKINGQPRILNLNTLKQTYFKKSQYSDAQWSPNNKYVAFGRHPSHQDFEQTDFIVSISNFKSQDVNAKALAWLDDHWIVYEAVRNGERRLEIRDLETNVAHDLGKFESEYTSARDLYASISPDKAVVASAPTLNKLSVTSLIDGAQSEYSTQYGKFALYSTDEAIIWALICRG